MSGSLCQCCWEAMDNFSRSAGIDSWQAGRSTKTVKLAFSTCTEPPMKEAYQGSCLCAAVGFELLAPPEAVTHCHCTQCRKGHGAAFASYGSVARSKLRVLRGANSSKSYAASTTAMREFCADCGSTLFWSRSQGSLPTGFQLRWARLIRRSCRRSRTASLSGGLFR